jgi:FkbM family methyltransferase
VLVRPVLEQMTHRIAVLRRLPRPFDAARIYVSSEGGLRYLRRRMDGIDPTLLGLAAEVVMPGNVVWDIGANLGLFSFSAAVAAGSSGYVLAIEPDALLVELLRRSAATNRLQASVEVLPVAISDGLGVARFHIAKRNRSTNYLEGFGGSQTGGVRSTELVPTVSLDWLAMRFPMPDVIKIDVEGAEYKVLTGGESVLGARPTIICEVSNRNAEQAGKFLGARGYTLYDGAEPIDQRRPLDLAPWTTLATSRM